MTEAETGPGPQRQLCQRDAQQVDVGRGNDLDHLDRCVVTNLDLQPREDGPAFLVQPVDEDHRVGHRNAGRYRHAPRYLDKGAVQGYPKVRSRPRQDGPWFGTVAKGRVPSRCHLEARLGA